MLNLGRHASCLSCGIRNNLDVQFPAARAVEFREEDALPAAEREFPVDDPYGLRRARQGRLNVRIGIAFRVRGIRDARYETVECRSEILRHCWIVAFVDDYARGGMRDIEMADAVGASRFADGCCDLVGHVLQLGASFGAHMERLQQSRRAWLFARLHPLLPFRRFRSARYQRLTNNHHANLRYVASRFRCYDLVLPRACGAVAKW